VLLFFTLFLLFAKNKKLKKGKNSTLFDGKKFKNINWAEYFIKIQRSVKKIGRSVIFSIFAS
jgi:hypothetical protein